MDDQIYEYLNLLKIGKQFFASNTLDIDFIFLLCMSLNYQL